LNFAISLRPLSAAAVSTKKSVQPSPRRTGRRTDTAGRQPAQFMSVRGKHGSRYVSGTRNYTTFIDRCCECFTKGPAITKTISIRRVRVQHGCRSIISRLAAANQISAAVQILASHLRTTAPQTRSATLLRATTSPAFLAPRMRTFVLVTGLSASANSPDSGHLEYRSSR
jgi:hypothetical protein